MASGYIHFSDENTNIIIDNVDKHYYELKQPAYYNFKTIKIDLLNPWVGVNGVDTQFTGSHWICDLPVAWIDSAVCGYATFQFYEPNSNTIYTIECIIYGFTDANNRKNDNLKIVFTVVE